MRMNMVDEFLFLYENSTVKPDETVLRRWRERVERE
jgi:hypothetical protein